MSWNKYIEMYTVGIKYNYNTNMLECIVDWYDGSTTKEIIIGQTKDLYLFNYHENNNYFAPKSWCSIINIT